MSIIATETPLAVYLETSLFGWYYETVQSPVYHYWTLEFFEAIRDGRVIPYTSRYVVRELEATRQQPKRDNMLALIDQYGMEVLKLSEETRRMARIYMDEGIVPASKENDAFHIATATVYGLSAIVSYNFDHIVKKIPLTRIAHEAAINAINLREGYQPIKILTPEEILKNV